MSYKYFKNINIPEYVVKECVSLLDEEETRPSEFPHHMYDEYLPEQVGFYKKSIEPFPVEGLDISKCVFQVILQKPGRMLPWHIDAFQDLKDNFKADNIRTYLCFLSDWKPGQIFGTVDDTYTHWKKGDTITWEYLVWHFSSNSSLKPKLTVQICEPY